MIPLGGGGDVRSWLQDSIAGRDVRGQETSASSVSLQLCHSPQSACAQA